MSCIIRITTGNNEKVEMEIPSLPNSLSELKEILRKSGKLGELNTYIKNSVNQGNVLKDRELSKILETEKPIPNTTAKSLQSRFPSVTFPDNIDLTNIPVLLVNQYKTTDGQLVFGRVDVDGKIMFILDKNKFHIEKFADYLALQQSIEDDNWLEKQNKDTTELLEKCRMASNYSSIKSMALDYLNNKNIFRDFRTTEGISVFTTLDTILSELGQDSRRERFNDSTANEFWQRLKNYNKETGTSQIGLKELYDQVLMYDEEIKKVIPDSFEKFKEFLKSKTTSEDAKKLFGEETLKGIIDYITNKEPWLNIKFKSLYKDTITVEKVFPNIKRTYGIGYDTIKVMSYDRYKSWYIFNRTVNGKTEYFPSKWYLTESTRTYKFDSLEEAQNFINEHILSSFLKDDKLQFLYDKQGGLEKGGKFITPETLIHIKDYPVNFNISLKEEEANILRNGKMSDFYQYLQKLDPSGQIRELIQNGNEANLFIYKINEGKRDFDTMLQIAKDIHNADDKYFYIEKSYKDNKDVRWQRYVEAKGNSIKEYENNSKAPVIQVFTAISEVLSPKFGIETEILSESEIQKKYGIDNSKAFILGDKIVLNSTLGSTEDLFHEYSHLVLGYLKHINPEAYNNLMESVWNESDQNTKNYIKTHYEALPRLSQMEELFVSKFGDYISNNYLNKRLEKIFKESEDFFKDGIKSMFDGETNIKKIFGKSLTTVFQRFNQEIGHVLKQDNEFLSFIKSDEFYLQRKKNNWLGKQISKGKIIERC